MSTVYAGETFKILIFHISWVYGLQCLFPFMDESGKYCSAVAFLFLIEKKIYIDETLKVRGSVCPGPGAKICPAREAVQTVPLWIL